MDSSHLPGDALASIAPDLRITRILNGMWQVSGAHGAIDPHRAVSQMDDYVRAGLRTWDLADHYGPAEDLVGEYRKRLAAEGRFSDRENAKFFTKWVPSPGPMSRKVVEQAIAISKRRMRVDKLDLLQFHWWDYANDEYWKALRHLDALRQEGHLAHLALTNFDTRHWEQIVDRGVEVITNQVQYSIVDARPAKWMAPFAEKRGLRLLTYGTLCGGLLTDRYLGRPAPAQADLTTASLRKYYQMVMVWGGWDLFQELLRALRGIADSHGTSIANVAVRYVLEQPAVAGVIVGARLGISEHIQENLNVFSFRLDAEDYAKIERVTARSRDLLVAIGDCGDEYR